MKVLVCTKPGVLEYQTVAEPISQPGHTILKIKRIGICGTDLHAYKGNQPYFTYPRILGHELAAELIEYDGLEGFAVGDAVTFIPYFNCGKCIACRNHLPNCCVNLRVFGVHIDGGMQEYISVPSASLIKGDGLNYDELALAEPLAIGAHGVRRAGIASGEFVLVIGAGPIGLGAMKFAQIAGGKIIAMDVNEERLQFCREKLQLDFTINTSSEDVFTRLRDITSGDMPTVIIDATGNKSAINNALQYLAHGGRFVLIGLQKEAISYSHPEFHKREATLMSSRNATRQDFEQVISCMKNGIIDPRTFITHQLKFDDLKDAFESWLYTSGDLIKAMVTVG